MNHIEQTKIESEALTDFAAVMQADTGPRSSQSGGEQLANDTGGQVGRINIDHDNVKNGLGQLVLTLVKLLHELIERQAIRRIEAGFLSDDEIERLGVVTLMKQAQEIDRLRKQFGLEEEDLTSLLLLCSGRATNRFL